MSEDLVQGTAEWHQARLGKVTASRMGDLAAKTKSGWGASRATYMAQLIAERLTGVPGETYTNAAMQWGTEKEPEARSAYEFRFDKQVVEVGFVPHRVIDMSGASPDGYVGDNGLVEIKCPNTSTHIDTLLGGTVPSKYELQMQWQLACTDRSWVDFVSYDPRLPPSMQLFVYRVKRDDKKIFELEEMVKVFLAEVDIKVRELSRRYA